MKLPNPFVEHSPYEEIELSRRENYVLLMTNVSMLFSIPLIVLVLFMLVFADSPLMLLAFLLCLGFPVFGFIAKKITERGNPNAASYLLIGYILLLISVNSTILEGLDPILVPAFILVILLAGLMLGSFHIYIIVLLTAGLYLATRAAQSFGIPQVPLPRELTEVTIITLVLLALTLAAVLSQVSISELRKALDTATYKLVRANRKLEHASEMKTQFTARTSHELRTPLSAIIVFTDLAMREAYGPLNEKLENALEHVLNSARHLKNVISDILDISKIEAGELEIVEAPFKVMALIESLQSSCEVMAEEKGLEYQIHLDPDLPERVIGDEGRLAQVLMNLSGNAVKFTEEGKVDVGIHLVGDEQWGFSVSDTGSGIPEDQFESIFNAYKQINASYQKGKNEGTGLGLAITKHLVEQMGGVIQFESRLGKGTNFEVFLPLKVPQEDIAAMEIVC
jgi:signal transduction histidine kinase